MVLPLVCPGSRIGPALIVHQLLQERVIEPLFCEHYLIGDLALSFARRARIAQVFAPPNAVLATLTATWVYVGGPVPARLTVVLEPGSTGPRRSFAIRVVRTSVKSADLTVVDGVPITSMERTVVDLARWEPDRVAREAITELVSAGADMERAIRMVPDKQRNSARARDLLAELGRELGS